MIAVQERETAAAPGRRGTADEAREARQVRAALMRAGILLHGSVEPSRRVPGHSLRMARHASRVRRHERACGRR